MCFENIEARCVPKSINGPPMTGQVQEVYKKLSSLVNELATHIVQNAKVVKNFGNLELSVDRNLLRHIANQTTRNQMTLDSRLFAQHCAGSRVQADTTDNASENCCFTTTGRTKQTIAFLVQIYFWYHLVLKIQLICFFIFYIEPLRTFKSSESRTLCFA